MTYINISITINEEAIRDQAIKLWRRLCAYVEQHYREAYLRACDTGVRHSQSPLVAGVHKILGHERRDFTGTILCDNNCRRRSCPGHTLAVSTYTRKMKVTQ